MLNEPTIFNEQFSNQHSSFSNATIHIVGPRHQWYGSTTGSRPRGPADHRSWFAASDAGDRVSHHSSTCLSLISRGSSQPASRGRRSTNSIEKLALPLLGVSPDLANGKSRKHSPRLYGTNFWGDDSCVFDHCSQPSSR